ncbi:hypothetical protein [Amycolatopsis nigrescens]|uniref:hypothetical protein n=1 Tax=Amycolatopsis nigrescens TaxID=381445 RepID=UPI00036CEF79|nr:hypothetical protein [Amycolatopsis nigrescens]
MFSRITWREWLGLAAGLLALGSLFLTWTGLSAGNPEIEDALREVPESDVLRDGWNSGFLAWCPPILLLLAGFAVIGLARVPGARKSGLPQLWLVIAGVALLLSVLGWLIIDGQYGSEQRGLFEQVGIEVYAGVGRYLGLLGAVVSVAVSVLDARAARRESRR